MTLAVAERARTVVELTTYHGIPTLQLRVDDPIPSPRAPQRYAVHVTPDLARYLLTFNHPNNRSLRNRKVVSMASDMVAGRWQFTPEPVLFTRSGVLVNGQNRLTAVTEAGQPEWLMLDFGWQDEIINVIDRAAARTNADALKIDGSSNVATLAAAVTRAWQYDRTVGTTLTWNTVGIPTSPEVLGAVAANPDAWHEAARMGMYLYHALSRGGSSTSWAAAHYIIGREHPDRVGAFLDEIAEGTGAVRSPTRILADWFRRRPDAASRTGDKREPLELIIRGFNASVGGKPFAHPKFKGFVLSRVRLA